MQIKELRIFLGSKKGVYLIVSLVLILHFLFVVSSAWNHSPPVDFDKNIMKGHLFYSKGIIVSEARSVFGQGHLFGLVPSILGIELDEKTWFLGNFRAGNNKGLLAFHNALDKNEMNNEFYEEAKKAKKEEIVRRVLRLSLIIEAIISVLTAAIIFHWAKLAFGIKSGYMALLLYSFSPFMTTIAQNLHADNSVKFLATLAFFYFWKFTMSPNMKHMILAAVFLGASMSVKVTASFYPFILLILLIIALLINQEFKEKIKALFKFKWSNKYTNSIFVFLLICIIAIFVINSFFLFQDVFKPLSKYNYEDYTIKSSIFLSINNSFLGKIPIPLSAHYITGIDHGKFESEEPGYLFFLGKLFLDAAPKSFYFVSLFVKTTTPVLISFFIAHLMFIIILLSKSNEKIKKVKFNYIYLFFIIYFLLIFYTIAAYSVNGLRHLSMIYPFIFICASSIISIKFSFSKYLKYFIWILVGWHIMAYLLAYPYYIPYFNELVGKNKGYLYFRDSNIDYHEAYYHAIEYKKAHPEVILFPPCIIEKGKVSMSPNDLNFQRAACYGWLKNFEPVDFIANSWPVYEVDGKWVQDNKGLINFIPSEKMKPRKAKINPFLKKFIE